MYSDRERDGEMESERANAGVRQTAAALKNTNLVNGLTRKSNNADRPGKSAETTSTHGGELVQNANYTNGQTTQTQATIFLSHNNNSHYNNGHNNHRKNPPNSQQNQQNACVYTTNHNNSSNNSNNNPEQNFSNLNFYAQQPAAHYDVWHQQVCVSVWENAGVCVEPQANFPKLNFPRKYVEFALSKKIPYHNSNEVYTHNHNP